MLNVFHSLLNGKKNDINNDCYHGIMCKECWWDDSGMRAQAPSPVYSKLSGFCVVKADT